MSLIQKNTALEEEVPFFDNYENGQNEQEHGLYDFAVRMGHEYFIEKSCRYMKHDGYQDVAVGFVIKPIHQKDIRN